MKSTVAERGIAAHGRARPWWRIHLGTRAKRELFAYLAVSPWIINFLLFILFAMVASLPAAPYLPQHEPHQQQFRIAGVVALRGPHRGR